MIGDSKRQTSRAEFLAARSVATRNLCGIELPMLQTTEVEDLIL